MKLFYLAFLIPTEFEFSGWIYAFPEWLLDLGLLRHFKALQVLCIVFLVGRQRDFHLVGILPRGESPLGNLPLLGLYAQQLIDHLIASNAGISNCADQLLALRWSISCCAYRPRSGRLPSGDSPRGSLPTR